MNNSNKNPETSQLSFSLKKYRLTQAEYLRHEQRMLEELRAENRARYAAKMRAKKRRRFEGLERSQKERLLAEVERRLIAKQLGQSENKEFEESDHARTTIVESQTPLIIKTNEELLKNSGKDDLQTSPFFPTW
ncbi:hypothetical protein AB6A40_010599 [Gnathostoma spinigerum]|uniref:Uncharacterized protein n=1 Tax=Gnathostoma spinigerum TaxID=75299 RepID=A0ABD6EWN0_9BILA